MTPEQWVGLIIDRAAELRAAGVQRISVDGASAVLLPEYPASATGAAIPPGPPEKPPLHPFDDPEVFGGVLPGYEFPAAPPGAVE